MWRIDIQLGGVPGRLGRGLGRRRGQLVLVGVRQLQWIRKRLRILDKLQR
jgi:hypothetical protein